MGHILFEVNCSYHLRDSYKKDVDLNSKSRSEDTIGIPLLELMFVCKDNLKYVEKLEKRFHNKFVKLESYISSQKFWLNAKHIKTKQNRKLEATICSIFKVLCLV